MNRSKGFTLIELLIVVAIIAILAAIAVPNFLEAQVRAKVSRAYNDMRTLKTGLEAYRVDHPKYPPDPYGIIQTWVSLTTPVAYLSTIPLSPFKFKEHQNLPGLGYGQYHPYDYGRYDNQNGAPALAVGIQYVIVCPGPDEDTDIQWGASSIAGLDQKTKPAAFNALYDGTNGTRSSGDIIATNKALYNGK